MFVQVIKGRTTDAAALRARGDGWRDEVRPGATGYLGGTFGIADDGTFLDPRPVRRRGRRQGELRPTRAGRRGGRTPPSSSTARRRSASRATSPRLFGGGSDDAGFVQVMEGKVADRAKAEAFETPEMEAQLRAARPDLLGCAAGLVRRRVLRRGRLLHQRGRRPQGRGVRRVRRPAGGVHGAVRRDDLPRPPRPAARPAPPERTAATPPPWKTTMRSMASATAVRPAANDRRTNAPPSTASLSVPGTRATPVWSSSARHHATESGWSPSCSPIPAQR